MRVGGSGTWGHAVTTRDGAGPGLSGVPRRPEFPGAQPWVPDRLTPGSVGRGLQECRGCDLWEQATQAVPGTGAADADLVLLGEQPGDQEDRAGEPFVGPAGGFSTGHSRTPASTRTGRSARTPYTTSAGRAPAASNGSTSRRARGRSRRAGPWMVAELDLVRPSGLVVLGATAGKAVYGSSFRVGATRGTRQEFSDLLPGGTAPAHRPAWVLPTVHPSAVLRSRDRDADYAAFVSDLIVAAGLLGPS